MKFLCKIFGHSMFYGVDGLSGPSVCKRCLHEEPGVEWDRPPMPPVKPPKKLTDAEKIAKLQRTVDAQVASIVIHHERNKSLYDEICDLKKELVRLTMLANGCRPEAVSNKAPYGFCPKCNAPGRTRERRINGNDTCSAGHTYPSASAKVKP